MKKTLLFAVALMLNAAAFAQETGYQPGAIITLDNQRIQGLVKNVNLMPARILEDIKFKTAEGEKVSVYSPSQLLGYESQDNLFISKKTSDGRTIFVKKFNTGKLHLYGELTFDGSASYNVVFVPYIQLDTDPVIWQVRQISFKKQMLHYLKEAPNVCQQIEAGTLKWKHISDIVTLYNEEVKDR